MLSKKKEVGNTRETKMYSYTGWKIKFPHCGILTESCWNLKFTSSFRKDSAA